MPMSLMTPVPLTMDTCKDAQDWSAMPGSSPNLEELPLPNLFQEATASRSPRTSCKWETLWSALGRMSCYSILGPAQTRAVTGASSWADPTEPSSTRLPGPIKPDRTPNAMYPARLSRPVQLPLKISFKRNDLNHQILEFHADEMQSIK